MFASRVWAATCVRYRFQFNLQHSRSRERCSSLGRGVFQSAADDSLGWLRKTEQLEVVERARGLFAPRMLVGISDPSLPPIQGPFVHSLHSLQQTISNAGQRLENKLHVSTCLAFEGGDYIVQF